jgi:hypothetical protein
MTESQFSSKLLRALRQRMPQAWIQKFNDRISSGIPDAVVVHEGRATWLEFKVDYRKVTTIQHETLKLLKRGYVVRYWKEKIYWVTLIDINNPALIEGRHYQFTTFERLTEVLEAICRQM